MSELLKNWMISITCACVVSACLESLLPDGRAKCVVKLIGSLLLMGAVLYPLSGLSGRLEEIQAFGGLVLERESVEEKAVAGGCELLKAIIEERVAAYIQDKATEWGISCGVTIVCRYESESGLYYPDRAEISGTLTSEQKTALSTLIEDEVAIPIRQQTYTSEVG